MQRPPDSPSAFCLFKGISPEASPAELAKVIQRLLREQLFLEGVFHALQEGILVINMDGMILYHNQSAAELLGFPPDMKGPMWLGKMAPSLMQALDWDTFTQKTYAASTQEIDIHYPQHRCLRVYSTGFTPHEQKKEEAYFALILNDITAEKAKTEAWIEDEKLASVYMLAAGIAHEIGNPLNSLMIHLELIQRQLAQKGPKPEEVNRSIHICQEELQRMDHILQHFLKALKPVKPDLQPVHLPSIIHDVIDVQAAQLESLEIKVQFDWPALCPKILADPALLKQVFFNLIKNSLEAMDGGGVLYFRLKPHDQAMMLEIEDTGVGIQASALSQIMTPFYTTKASGHGLGLILVQRILRAHQATFAIQSTPGEGTCVRIQFPVQNPKHRMIEASS